MTIKIDDSCYYRVKDLVNLLSLNELTIRNYLKQNKLRGFKASRFWYISGRNLRIFLEGSNRKKFSGSKKQGIFGNILNKLRGV